jgi:sialate O-acetylesterase
VVFRVAMMRLKLLILATPFACLQSAWAAPLALGGPFSDHMVLQRDVAARVWGTGIPGAEVSVALNGLAALARVTSEGTWMVILPPSGPTPPGEVWTLEVTSGDERRTLRDVVCGDVWLCAGQSNMRYTLGRREDNDDPASRMIFGGDMEKATHSKIRFLSVSDGQGRTPPGRKWARCEPTSVVGFSAIGYFFGASLHERTGVPVGLIDLGKGGQSLRAFLPADIFGRHSRLPELGSGNPEKPSGVVHARDVRWLAPYTLRGVLWYQGESDITRADDYPTLLRRMVDCWRSDFRQPELPFFIVELPGYLGKKNDSADQRKQAKWRPRFREAQARFVDETPHTTFIKASDLGEPYEIHPRDKKPLAARLADAAIEAMADGNRGTITPETIHQ